MVGSVAFSVFSRCVAASAGVGNFFFFAAAARCTPGTGTGRRAEEEEEEFKRFRRHGRISRRFGRPDARIGAVVGLGWDSWAMGGLSVEAQVIFAGLQLCHC